MDISLLVITTLGIIGSLLALVKAGSVVLNNAIKIAEKAKLSPLLIGSTIVAIGTALPTMSVNLVGLFSENPATEIAVGNIVGSNWLNIGLGLGIPAVLTIVKIQYNLFEKEIPLYIAITAIFTSLVSDGALSRSDGLLLIVAYLCISLIIYNFSAVEKANPAAEEQFVDSTAEIKAVSTKSSLIKIVLGFVVLVGAALSLLFASQKFANILNLSDYFIGLTIVGMGTSLPVVCVNIASARKGYIDVVLGNVFGGSIFNICIGLGLPALFVSHKIDNTTLNDIKILSIVNIFLVLFILLETKVLGQNKVVGRLFGFGIVAAYLIFMYTKF